MDPGKPLDFHKLGITIPGEKFSIDCVALMGTGIEELITE